jgi:hypothetical protein
MAEKKEFEIEITSNLDKVAKNVDELSSSLIDVKNSADKVDKSLTRVETDVKDISKSGNQAANSLRKMGGAINGIASNIKGIGIGILATQFEGFKETLTSSNKVSDVFSNTLNTVKKSASDLGNLMTSGNFFKTLQEGLALTPTQAFEKASQYFSQASKDAAKVTELTNQALFASVRQQGIFEEYDRQAEEQRKVRDSELVSLDQRNKANEKLGVILGKQRIEMLAQANIQKDAAQAQFNLTGSRPDQLALMESENNILAIQAQLQGFITEQDQARISLLNERLQIQNAASRNAIDIDNAQIDSNNAIIKSDAERLKEQEVALKDRLREESQYYQSLELQFEKGTTRRAEIEVEGSQKLNEIRLALLANQDEQLTYFYNRDQELRQQVINNELEAFSSRLFALQKFNEEAQKSTQVSEDEKRKIANETLVQQRIIENQRISMVSNTLGNISSLFEASSTEGKAFAIAQSLINTYQGITAELATKTATPFEFGLKVANVATVAAMGFKAVKDIINTQPSSGGGIEMSGATPSSAAPQFNVVGASGINQVAQTINKQANTPVRAFVVSKDVTTAQSLDRNIVNAASM